MYIHAIQCVRKYFLFAVILAVFFLAPTIPEARAQGNHEQAVRLIQSVSSLSLAPLGQTRFGIGFKNTSGTSWKMGDTQKITLRAKARSESYFHHSSWQSGTIVMPLPNDTKNGEVVYFWFTLEAPKKTGDYIEEYALYSGEQRITFSVTRVSIRVDSRAAAVSKSAQPVRVQSATVPAVLEQKTPPPPVAQLTTTKLIQSANSLTLKQYERATFRVGFKNTSGTPWRVDASQPIVLKSKVAKESFFYDPSWINGNTVMRLPANTNDGEIAYFEFTLFAPIFPRDFQETLALYNGNNKIIGSDVSLPITVIPASSSILTQGNSLGVSQATLIETTPPVPPLAPTLTPTPSQPGMVRPGIVEDKTEIEPFIRVGLYHTTDPIRITANKDYDVRDQDGTLLGQQSAGVVTTVVFDLSQKTYTVTTPTFATTTTKYIRFRGSQVPYRTFTRADGSVSVEPVADQESIFEIPSYRNSTSWSSTINDNVFRGELEVRYAPLTNRLWVVNELLFEQYLKGIAETSNGSPYEYQKALIIAARTYAKYHIDRNSKHANEGFTVRPTEADQVYRGYGAEKRLPNIARAIDETRGVVVYYGDSLAITPYSSNTDGRTRSWEEVWGGGPKPWLVSVPDPCCTGMAMRYSSTSYSHGVGMSARGALAMALDNKGFEEILKYYYTNIELRKKY